MDKSIGVLFILIICFFFTQIHIHVVNISTQSVESCVIVLLNDDLSFRVLGTVCRKS